MYTSYNIISVAYVYVRKAYFRQVASVANVELQKQYFKQVDSLAHVKAHKSYKKSKQTNKKQQMPV